MELGKYVMGRRKAEVLCLDSGLKTFYTISDGNDPCRKGVPDKKSTTIEQILSDPFALCDPFANRSQRGVLAEKCECYMSLVNKSLYFARANLK